MKALYLHGLNTVSSGKAALLESRGHAVVCPALDHARPLAVREVLRATLAAHPDLDVAIGSSLGGFWGFYAAQRLGAPRTVLLNPCLDPDEAMRSVENPPPEGVARAYATLRAEAEAVPVDPSRFRVYVALDDDVVPPALAMKRFAAPSLRALATGGHRLAQFAGLVPEIAAFAAG
jgi:predicted esterase YcpF (UPF0227 family)